MLKMFLRALNGTFHPCVEGDNARGASHLNAVLSDFVRSNMAGKYTLRRDPVRSFACNLLINVLTFPFTTSGSKEWQKYEALCVFVSLSVSHTASFALAVSNN